MSDPTMGGAQQEPEIVALQAVYAALKGLDQQARQRVLASVFPLLEMVPFAYRPTSVASSQVAEPSQRTTSSRPLSLLEVVQDKKPSTNPEHITLFAYYRDKYEGKPRFSRDDLEPYFRTAKLPPPGNYGRDFAETVKRAWIHEAGTDSYITSKGIEAVEAGFSEPSGSPSSVRRPKKAKKAKRATGDNRGRS